MARKRRRPTEPEPITVDVQSLTNFAFNAGLTIDLAQGLLLDAEMEDCRVLGSGCREFCGGDTEFRTLVALRAFRDRDVIYCEGCNVADVGV